MDNICLPAFQVVVSDKSTQRLGEGVTMQKAQRCIYYYAEKQDQGDICVQALNGSFIPAGERTYMDDAEFCLRFRPEPLIFYNQVKPAMDNLSSTLEKADRHRQAERFDKAETAYKQAMRMDPDNLRAIFGLGITQLAMGDTEEAGHIFSRLMEIEFPFTSENKHLFNEFGIRLRRCGMLREGLEWYDKALQCSQCDSHLFFNKGRLHLDLGEGEQARECLCKALELEPDLEPARKMLQVLEKGIGQAAA